MASRGGGIFTRLDTPGKAGYEELHFVKDLEGLVRTSNTLSAQRWFYCRCPKKLLVCDKKNYFTTEQGSCDQETHHVGAVDLFKTVIIIM